MYQVDKLLGFLRLLILLALQRKSFFDRGQGQLHLSLLLPTLLVTTVYVRVLVRENVGMIRLPHLDLIQTVIFVGHRHRVRLRMIIERENFLGEATIALLQIR